MVPLIFGNSLMELRLCKSSAARGLVFHVCLVIGGFTRVPGGGPWNRPKKP